MFTVDCFPFIIINRIILLPILPMYFLRADIAGWPDASCRFPDWLAAVTWRDLAGQSRYSFDDDSMALFVRSSASSKHQQHHQHQSNERSEFRCLQRTSETDQHIVVYAFAMHNWFAENLFI